ncbi:hypothetical protein JM18_009545 [Phytophthora kernoviae]|uniref:RxLR effector protein n=2 Tax=Phytophthora kernoviae TaxID=325452 RepID=A0A921S930_9STRA|nr:hypothetical protein JM18_009545 [Phytophthora kernoviae]
MNGNGEDNAVLADSPAEARALNAVNNERGAKRSLRTTKEESDEDDSDDDEERIVALTRLKTKWKLHSMRKEADKDFKNQAKEILKLDKAKEKEQKQIDDLIKNLYTPEKVSAKLGLDKLDDPMTSINWPFYQAFDRRYEKYITFGY